MKRVITALSVTLLFAACDSDSTIENLANENQRLRGEIEHLSELNQEMQTQTDEIARVVNQLQTNIEQINAQSGGASGGSSE